MMATADQTTVEPQADLGNNSPLNRVVGLFEDHLALLELELHYETWTGRKRLIAWAAATGCILLAVACLQVAIIALGVRLGASLAAICAIFGLLWGIGGVLVHQYLGIRDSKAGEPFEGSRTEIRKTMAWIRQHTL